MLNSGRDMPCVELDPPPDICHSLKVTGASPGVTALVTDGKEVSATISESTYCSTRNMEINVTCSGAIGSYQLNDEPLYINVNIISPDVELYIVETQTGSQIGTESQMTFICNASNFSVTLHTITFFGPNNLRQVCPNTTAREKSFRDGTITRTSQTCILKILRPSLTYGGAYYCQVQPVRETCFNYTSNKVEVLLSNNDYIYYFHAFEGALSALVIVSCLLVLVLVFLVVLTHRECKKKEMDKNVPTDSCQRESDQRQPLMDSSNQYYESGEPINHNRVIKMHASA